MIYNIKIKNKSSLWFLIPLSVLLIIYIPVIQKFVYHWEGTDYNYCYLVPFVFLYLCWEKRKSFNFMHFSGNYTGHILLLFAVLIGFIGKLSALRFFLYLSFYLSLVSLGLTLYGRRLKHLIFPFIILFFMIPLPPFINRLLTFKFQLFTSSLAVFLLRLSGFSVFQEGNIIDLGITQLQVAEACSGLRYFMPMLLLCLLIGYYFLRSLLFRILLFIFVPLISIVANAFRIYLLAFFYIKGFWGLAQGFSHYLAGWFVFILALIFLLLIALIFKNFEYKYTKMESPPQFEKDIPPSKNFSVLISLFSLIAMIGGVGFYFLPKTYIIPKKADFSNFPLHINGWRGENLGLPSNILESLWADEYVYNVYRRAEFPGIIYVFIPYYNYQTTWHSAHTPQTCLLGGGWSILRSGEWKIEVYSNKFIPVSYMWLKKENEYMLATYFFIQNGRIITSPWLHKFYLLWDGLFHRQTNGALVRVEMLLNSNTSTSQAEYELKKFLFYLYPVLKNSLNF